MKSFWALLLIGAGALATLQAADVSGAAEEASTITPLLVGAAAPSVTVQTPDGKNIDLADYIKEKPTILVFYRGSWCPFCMKQLSQLEKLAPELEKLGYRLTAISQDKPKTNKIAQTKHKLSFPILSDTKLEAATRYGLVFKVDSETTTRYKGYGIDLVGLYGRTKPLMAVPGVFLFNEKGSIRFQYVNPDYRIRLSHDVLLAAVKSK